MADEDLIQRYFEAMRRGEEAADDLFSLFTDDAVYAEPFTGEEPAVGIDAIRRRFTTMWEDPLPDVELEILRLTVDGGSAVAHWECRSPGLLAPIRGQDSYQVSDGRIRRLDITILD